MQALRDVTGDGYLPNPYGDAVLLAEYAAAGNDPAHVLYLSLGETWTEAAPGLRAALATGVPRHAHGYMLSPYGLPALHRVLRDYITRTHGLDGAAHLGADYEVAVSQNSTRSVMSDFGRLLLHEHHASRGILGRLPGNKRRARGILVHTSPGWDYPGVYTALGYRMRPVPLRPETGYQPDPAEMAATLHTARAETAGPVILAINAQHNPTGANWAPETVRAMIQAARDTGAHVLIDDAYYALHDPHLPPTSALRILLEEYGHLPRRRRPRWLAVRSLGKQFHCSGWGIGALTADPDTVETLCAKLRPQYSYTSSVPLQAAMAAWLQNPDCETYLAQQRTLYAAKRTAVTERLHHDLGYPPLFPGEVGPFLLLPIPPHYPGPDGEDVRRHLLRRAGVLLGEAHMTTPGHRLNPSGGYVRLYLGPPTEVLHDALSRLAQAGLTWHTSPSTTLVGDPS